MLNILMQTYLNVATEWDDYIVLMAKMRRYRKIELRWM